MTTQQIEEMSRDIAETIKAGLDITAVFVPGSVAYLILGKALAAAVPGLAATVSYWIEGNPPSEDEIKDFKDRLAVLTDPNNP